MSFKIYTKTGDDGQTSLYGGRRVDKFNIRIDAYGTVDELNAHLGLIRDLTDDTSVQFALKKIQNSLFTIGAMLASDPEKKGLNVPLIEASQVLEMEAKIDEIDAKLPPLTNFILPGGHPIISQTHIARCVCRRAERIIVYLSDMEYVDPIVLQYMNRLSDFLFMLARFFTMELGIDEDKWTVDS